MYGLFLGVQEARVGGSMTVEQSYDELLLQRAGVVEVRAFKVGPPGEAANFVGRFDDPAAMRRETRRVSGNCEGVYTTLNQIDPAVLGETYPVLNVLAKGGAGIRDQDVSRRLWLPLDFDSTSRPKDKSASDDELAQCLCVSKEMAAYLEQLGWPMPVVGMSGNGAHLLYAVDLPSTDDVRDVIRRVFIRLAFEVLERWPEKSTKLDAVCYNASRIWKLYGTLARKGEASPGRPHREAFCRLPSELGLVSLEQLTALAGTAEEAGAWTRRYRRLARPGQTVDYSEPLDEDFSDLGGGDLTTLDVVAWFEAHQKYRFSMESTDEGKHSVFCPWADNHSSPQDPRGTDTVVWAPRVDGNERRWPIFHCSHESCGDSPHNPAGRKRDILQLVRLWKDAASFCAEEYVGPGTASGQELIEQVGREVGWKSRPVPTPRRPETVEPEGASAPVPIPTGLAEAAAPPSVAPAVKSDPASGRTWESLFGGFIAEPPPREERSEIPAGAEGEKAPGEAEVATAPKGAPTSDGSSGDSAGGSSPSPDGTLFPVAGDRFTLQYLIDNLVTIEGTSITYHIGGDWLMSSTHLASSYRDLLKKWSKSRHRQVIHKSKFVFDPELPPLIHPSSPGVLNRFRGLPVIPPSDADYTLVMDHLKYLCEDDETSFRWFLGWLAYQVQHPGRKLRSAVIFKGVEGVGKNIFFDIWYRRIFGKYGTSIGAEALCSRYNSWALDKLFILGNEISTSKDRRDIPNKLKSYITDPSFNYEAKFMDILTEEPNRMNFVFLSNEDVPVTISSSDRRYAIFEVRVKKTQDYYWRLLNVLHSGGFNAFYHYLRKLDLASTGFDPGADPPWNETKTDTMELRASPVELFLAEVMGAEVTGAVTEGRTGVAMLQEDLFHLGAVTSQDLWEAFLLWAKVHNRLVGGISSKKLYSIAKRFFREEVTRSVFVDASGRLLEASPASTNKPEDRRRRTVRFLVTKPAGSLAELIASARLFRQCLDANIPRGSVHSSAFLGTAD